MRVYISGPMSGLEDNNRKAFDAAEKDLKARGFDVVNPHNVKPSQEFPTYHDYLKADLREMLLCDAVYALPGWGTSNGAWIECGLAKEVGIPVKEYNRG